MLLQSTSASPAAIDIKYPVGPCLNVGEQMICSSDTLMYCQALSASRQTKYISLSKDWEVETDQEK